MSVINPVPQTAQLVDQDGLYTVYFKRYLDQQLARTGGITGGIYNELTFGSSITWDLDQNPIAVVVLTGNTSIGVINQVAGFIFPYRLTLVQDGTGGRTVSWGSMFKWPSATPPTLSSGADAVDELWFSSDGTNMKGIVGSKDLR